MLQGQKSSKCWAPLFRFPFSPRSRPTTSWLFPISSNTFLKAVPSFSCVLNELPILLSEEAPSSFFIACSFSVFYQYSLLHLWIYLLYLLYLFNTLDLSVVCIVCILEWFYSSSLYWFSLISSFSCGYQLPSLIMGKGYNERVFVPPGDYEGRSRDKPRMESLRYSRIAIQHPFCFNFIEKFL